MPWYWHIQLFVEIDLNEVQDTGNCNDEVQTVEYKSCSKKRISIASEYDYNSCLKHKTQSAGSSSGKVFYH